MDNQKRKIYVSYDIEKAGTPMVYPVLSVAFVVADRNKNILQMAKFNRATHWPDEKSKILVRDGFKTIECFEPRCWEEFWCDGTSMVRKYLKEACLTPEPMHETKMWADIRDFIDQIELQYDDCKIVWVSDNPSFDTAHIDINLEVHCKRGPMRTGKNGDKYMQLVVPDDARMGLPKHQQDWIVQQANAKTEHTHDCLYDAKNIMWQWLFLLDVIDENKTAAKIEQANKDMRRRVYWAMGLLVLGKGLLTWWGRRR